MNTRTPYSIAESKVPWYSIGRFGSPPNVAIEIFCVCRILVTKRAQVDAQFPIPTGERGSVVAQSSGVGSLLLITMRLEGRGTI